MSRGLPGADGPAGAALTDGSASTIMERGIVMTMMKRAVIIFLTAAFAATLNAQSVAELARKERARREALKEQSSPVVTNEDLLRVKKRPAIEIAAAGWDVVEGELTAPPPQMDSPANAGTTGPLPSGSAAPSRRITPRVTAPGPSLTGDAESADQAGAAPGSGIGPLEAQLHAAEELVDLLETKLAALKQEYEFQNNMVPNYVIEKQLNETLQRLQKAQAQEARIRAELQRGGRGRRAPDGPDR